MDAMLDQAKEAALTRIAQVVLEGAERIFEQQQRVNLLLHDRSELLQPALEQLTLMQNLQHAQQALLNDMLQDQ
jgi:hypothetical protein